MSITTITSRKCYEIQIFTKFEVQTLFARTDTELILNSWRAEIRAKWVLNSIGPNIGVCLCRYVWTRLHSAKTSLPIIVTFFLPAFISWSVFVLSPSPAFVPRMPPLESSFSVFKKRQSNGGLTVYSHCGRLELD